LPTPTFELAVLWDLKSVPDLAKAFIESLATTFPPTDGQEIAVTLRPGMAALTIKPSFALYSRHTLKQLEADAKRSGGRLVELLRLPADERESFRKQFLAPASGEPQMVAHYKSAAATIAQHLQGSTTVEVRTRATATPSQSKAPPVLDKARRVSPRYPVNFEVEFKTDTDLVREHATNISKGGIFIRTTKRPGLNSEIGLDLKLPNGEILKTSARVVHIMDHPQYGGIGLAFPPGDTELSAALEKYLATLAAKGAS
jgi:uncharacterized protein (TIGR02266 family)